MSRTKIVVTLGPSANSPETIRQLIEAGMDVARLNFSHGSHEEHLARLTIVRAESARVGRPVAILQDLQGPKIRTGALSPGETVTLVSGQTFTITTEPVVGNSRRVSTTYHALPSDVQPGDRVLISDGLIEMRVIDTSAGEVVGEIVHGGELRANQGVNLPGVRVSSPAVTDKDLEDLRFGLANDIDYLAVSFVRRAEDVARVREAMTEAGHSVPVITKLEKPEALDALPEILAASDGVMVARGDLGVEMPPERVPLAQKEIIRLANRMAIPVITATQMLESMIGNPRPTRAEVSDVANAILDGSDAVMLSGETSIGRHPVRAVAMMARIAEEIDHELANKGARDMPSWMFERAETVPDAIGAAVSAISRSMPLRAVCVVTKTGGSARIVSHYRPDVPVLAFTPVEQTYRRLALLWGVTPIKTTFAPDEDEYYRQVQRLLLHRGDARPGDMVVVTGGHPIVQGGPTNFLKILTVTGDVG